LDLDAALATVRGSSSRRTVDICSIYLTLLPNLDDPDELRETVKDVVFWSPQRLELAAAAASNPHTDWLTLIRIGHQLASVGEAGDVLTLIDDPTRAARWWRVCATVGASHIELGTVALAVERASLVAALNATTAVGDDAGTGLEFDATIGYQTLLTSDQLDAGTLSLLPAALLTGHIAGNKVWAVLDELLDGDEDAIDVFDRLCHDSSETVGELAASCRAVSTHNA
jgi:hypothetical protein